MTPSLLTLALLSGPAQAAEITVCREAALSCDFDSLSAAIASSAAGDTLLVGPGRWSEPLSIDHSLSLMGMGPVPPSLDGALGLLDPMIEDVITVTGASTELVISQVNITSLIGRGLRIEDASVFIDNSGLTAVGGVAYGGIIYADGGSLSLDNVILDGGKASVAGGLVYANNTRVDLSHTLFLAGHAGLDGGALALQGSSVLDGVDLRFEQNLSGSRGGAMALDDGVTASLSDVKLKNNISKDGGGLSCVGCNLHLIYGEISDNRGELGGALFGDGAYEIELLSTNIERNDAHSGGGVALYGDGNLAMLHSTFCTNTGLDAGGGFYIRSPDATATLANTLFFDNRSRSGAAIMDLKGALKVLQNDFIANSQSPSESAVLLIYASSNLRNNLFMDEPGNAAQVDFLPPDSQAPMRLAYNAFWNVGAQLFLNDEGELVNEHPVDQDPLLLDARPLCKRNLFKQSWHSSLRDAGAPNYQDPDDTRSDIGIFGGQITTSTNLEFLDHDSDGYIALYDCDEARRDVHPEAEEIWYDGFDQDCDRRSDFDQDQDGHDALAYGGQDCDDLDSSIFPGANELPRDGVDQDCDGADLLDADHDGYPASKDVGDRAPFADCDDTRADVYPGAPELDDNIDHDCDGSPGLPVPLHIVGCQTAPTRWGTAWGLLMLIVGATTRRRRTAPSHRVIA